MKNIVSEYKSYDGEKIFYKVWQASSEEGIIQISHGLGEMADYYEEFGKAANDHNLTVYLSEARGHGRTRAPFNQENILIQYAKDIYEQNKIIREKHIGKPIFLLGHSLGTIIGQVAALQFPGAWQGVIFSGIPYYENIFELLGSVEREIKEKGENAISEVTFLKMFSHVNDAFPKSEGLLAWLTSDSDKRNYYEGLPYTKVSYSNRFYKDFLEKLEEVQKYGIATYEDTELPIFIIGGSHDVVSNDGLYGKAKAYGLVKNGFTNIKVKIYPEFRHSILQEKNRDQVYKDILNWVATAGGIWRCCCA